MKPGDIAASRWWVRAWCGHCGGGRKRMSAWWECSLSSDQGVRTSLDRGSWEVPASRIFRQSWKNRRGASQGLPQPWPISQVGRDSQSARRPTGRRRQRNVPSIISQCIRSASLAQAQTETGLKTVGEGWGDVFFSFWRSASCSKEISVQREKSKATHQCPATPLTSYPFHQRGWLAHTKNEKR